MNDDSPTRAERIREKSAKRRERQRRELRRAILDAAGELFLEHGYEGFSLRQVAEHVGYSPTTIYLYFEDKDELLFTVVLEGFTRFGQTLQEAYESEDEPLARIEALGRAYIRFGLENPTHYRLMFMQRGDFLMKERPTDKKPTIHSFGILVKAVQEALAAGVMKPGDPLTYAHVLWATVHGAVALTLSVPVFAEIEHERRLDALFAMMKSGLQAR